MSIINIRVMKRLLIIILSVSLISCSISSKPSESDARSILDEKLNRTFSEHTISINNFSKVNGGEVNSYQGIRYRLEYKGQISFQRKCSYQFSQTYLRWYSPGESENIKGFITFREMENGWDAVEWKVLIDE